MAKKKNKQIIRPWCWYCEREFEDEKVLMQHQKAKHFKCNMCPRRLNTAGGLAVHIQQVHKLEPENLPRIENAIPGRDGYEVEIFGMEGIPAPDVADYKRRKEIELGLAAGSISQPPPKRPKVENRVLTEAELQAALAQHKALMGQNADPDALAKDGAAGGVVYGAPPQAYSAPPTAAIPPIPPNMPMPPFPPGATPPFPPPFAMPPGAVPPGMPPFPPPPGMVPPGISPVPPGISPPPGMPIPPFGPPGAPIPPPGMPGAPPVPPGGLMRFAAPPAFVLAGQPPAGKNGTPAPGPPPPQGQQPAPNAPAQIPKPEVLIPQTNPDVKGDLKFKDANISAAEHRAYHPKYYFDKATAGEDAPRGTKRARAEDFL
ncbi:hypothetical protein GGG16DRAFT_127494 [Schizophyllum commune]